MVPSVVSSAPQPINPAIAPLTAPISEPQRKAQPENGHNRQTENVEAIERGERRHGEVGAHRQIDAADGDDNQQRKDDQAAVGSILSEIAQIGGE